MIPRRHCGHTESTLFGVLPRITTLRDVDRRTRADFPAVRLDGRAARDRAASAPCLPSSLPCNWRCSRRTRPIFASFANSSIALMFGVALTGVICGIVRLLGTGWIASRLLRSNWRTLAAVAERKSHQDRVAIASLMQHRLALLAARITVGSCRGEERRRQSSPASNGAEHHRCQAGEPRPVTLYARAAIEALLARLASVCRTHSGRPASGRAGRTARQHDRIDVARTGERGSQ